MSSGKEVHREYPEKGAAPKVETLKRKKKRNSVKERFLDLWKDARNLSGVGKDNAIHKKGNARWKGFTFTEENPGGSLSEPSFTSRENKKRAER